MEDSRVEISKLAVDFAPAGVPYAVILPPGYGRGAAVPLCLVLHGGGGSHRDLVDSKPVFDALWAAGAMPPMVLASASISPLGFYLDHSESAVRWERFIAQDFVAALRRNYKVGADRDSTIITGTSMGGHGSLRIAFRNPDRFAAVAALEPALDPALELNEVGERNHFFYPLVLDAGGDVSADELVGSNRDAALFRASNPANVAIANAEAIRASVIRRADRAPVLPAQRPFDCPQFPAYHRRNPRRPIGRSLADLQDTFRARRDWRCARMLKTAVQQEGRL